MKKFIFLLGALSFTTSCKTMSEKQDNSEVEAFIPLGNGLTKLTKTCAIISENKKAAAAAKLFYRMRHKSKYRRGIIRWFVRENEGTHYMDNRYAFRNSFVNELSLVNQIGYAQKTVKYFNNYGRNSGNKKIILGVFQSFKNYPFQLITPKVGIQNTHQRKPRKKCQPKFSLKIEGFELNFGKGCSNINRNKKGNYFRFTYIYKNKRTGLREANGLVLDLPYADENPTVSVPALLCQEEVKELSFMIDSINTTRNAQVIIKGINFYITPFKRHQILN